MPLDASIDVAEVGGPSSLGCVGGGDRRALQATSVQGESLDRNRLSLNRCVNARGYRPAYR